MTNSCARGGSLTLRHFPTSATRRLLQRPLWFRTHVTNEKCRIDPRMSEQCEYTVGRVPKGERPGNRRLTETTFVPATASELVRNGSHLRFNYLVIHQIAVAEDDRCAGDPGVLVVEALAIDVGEWHK